MTGARHLLLAVVAAAIALVLGVALGAGPVTEDAAAARQADNDRLASRVAGLTGQVQRQRAAAAGDARAVSALAQPLTVGALADRTVLVVVAPGARKRDVRAVTDAVESADGTVLSTLTLLDAYVDPAKAQSPLEDLSLRLVPPGVEFPDGVLPIDRVGTVLARATVHPSDEDVAPDDVDQDAAEVIAGLDELAALRLDGRPGQRADLAVLVAGPDADPDAEPALTGLLAALDRGSSGAVVTAPGDAGSGLLRTVRTDGSDQMAGVSSVDSAGTPVGSAALVLALAEQVRGRDGHYGLGRAARRVVPPVAGD